MTDWNQFVIFLSPTLPGPIEPILTLTSPPAGRTFRRRRLGLLTGILVATVGIGGLAADTDRTSASVVAAGAVSSPGPDEGGAVEAEAVDDGVVVAQSSGTAALADVFASTTSTLLAATTTTVAEATTTTAAPTTTQATTSTTAPPTTAAPTATTAPPTTAAPTTTTAPPRSSSPTTAAPSSSSESDYGDPDTLQVWLDLAQCESGGNWAIDSGNGYYGGLQFSLGTWESVGGTGYPNEHPRDTQIEMGRRLQARQGWGAWPHCSEELGLR